MMSKTKMMTKIKIYIPKCISIHSVNTARLAGAILLVLANISNYPVASVQLFLSTLQVVFLFIYAINQVSSIENLVKIFHKITVILN